MKRHDKIYDLLITYRFINIKEITQMFQISERTLRSDLLLIKEKYLNSKSYIKKQNNSYLLIEDDVIQNMSKNSNNPMFDFNERTSRVEYIKAELFKNRHKISFEELLNTFLITSHTLNLDLEYLNLELKQYNFSIIVDDNHVLWIKGERQSICWYLQTNGYCDYNLENYNTLFTFFFNYIKKNKLNVDINLNGIILNILMLKDEVFTELPYSEYIINLKNITRFETKIINQLVVLLRNCFDVNLAKGDINYLIYLLRYAALFCTAKTDFANYNHYQKIINDYFWENYQIHIFKDENEELEIKKLFYMIEMTDVLRINVYDRRLQKIEQYYPVEFSISEQLLNVIFGNDKIHLYLVQKLAIIIIKYNLNNFYCLTNHGNQYLIVDEYNYLSSIIALELKRNIPELIRMKTILVNEIHKHSFVNGDWFIVFGNKSNLKLGNEIYVNWPLDSVAIDYIKQMIFDKNK